MKATINVGGAVRGTLGSHTTAPLGLETLEERALLSATTHLLISAPTQVTAGGTADVTISAVDATNATVTGYTGTIGLNGSAGISGLPSTYTFTAADAGSHVFHLQLQTEGGIGIAAFDATTKAISGFATITVVPAPLDHFGVSVVTTANAGAQVPVTVTALDQYGNRITTYSGQVVLAGITDPNVPTGTYQFTAADAGQHTFSGQLTQATAGIITVHDAVSVNVTGSATVNVSPGAIDHFGVFGPTSYGAGQSFGVVIYADDAYGNTVTNFTGTVTVAASDPQFTTTPVTVTFTAADNGVVSVPVTLYTAGPQTVTANATVPGINTGDPSRVVSGGGVVNITAGVPTQLTLTTSGPATITNPTDVTITAKDQYGNVVTGYTGTVTVTSDDGSVSFQHTFIAADAGTVSLPVQFPTAGVVNLTAVDAAVPTLTTTAQVTVGFPDGNSNYVNAIYEELLGRNADAGGVAYWTLALDAGMSRSTLVSSIEGGTEFETLYVNQQYESVLGRAADGGGLAYYVTQMSQGMTFEQVTANLMASDEYYQNRGNATNTGFLAQVFQDTLGRAIDPTAAQAFGSMLTQGTPRLQVIEDIMYTPEAHTVLITASYEQFLNRDPDTGGLKYFLNMYSDGMTTSGMIASILASDEYFASTQTQG